MRTVLGRRDIIADAARRLAPSKRYWAVVGSGANKVAAEEVRIKLSELCYKSIACDVTEDKKHIDLSSEPLILVCAAGLAGSTADDVGKEVAIFRAHKATPIVIADDGDGRYPATAVIPVPPVDPALGFVLSAMAGHLFGYEAALAIDASARPLREAMEVIDRALSSRALRGRRARATAAEAPAARRAVHRRAARPPLRRPPRGEHGRAPRRPAARRAIGASDRGVPGGHGQGRVAGCAGRRPRPRR